MGFIDYALYQLFFIIAMSAVIIYIRGRSDYHQGDKALGITKLFLFGFAGWILAYARVIIIQIYQVILLVNEGIDITNQAAILESEIIYSYAFNIIGPLLSGPFEEGIRYFLLIYVLKEAINPVDRKYAPLIFGLGWALSEIMILTIAFITVDSVSLINFLFSGYERILAIGIHVCLSYFAVYAKFDNKKSLWMAMIIHSGINTILLVLVLETTPGLASAFLIEGILTVMIVILVLYTRSYVSKNEKLLADRGIDERWTK